MTSTIELPIWLFVLIVLFAAVTLASHFLFPSVRWFFRRRMERVVARLNQRLERPIEPFKLARRYDMIQRLCYDPEVARAIAAHARKKGVPENVAFQQARRYAREIVPRFSATAYFGFATRVAKWLSLTLYRVRIGTHDEDAFTRIGRDATLVFVMNHRSNMDYVLVTWIAAERSALAYAVGEWARVWPLSALIRAMGAYFIRRRSPDDLYRRVLARYVGLATDGGVAQAVFPEGGLSLDGKLAQPRLGILKYIVEERSAEGRDVVFIPVALNYDRVFEDRVLIAASKRGKRRFPARISVVARFVLLQVRLWLTRRHRRHGQAAVSFGAPLSLRDFTARNGGATVETLGARLMQEIGAQVPVLPVPLVAHLLVQAGGPVTEQALVARAREVLDRLPPAHGITPDTDVALTVSSALEIMRRRGMLAETDGRIAPAAEASTLLAYYANSIAHLPPTTAG
ncbi:1-acyl-sn-glycerol-3-phosphate acyltransferase [Roseovarius amoyensis]|uniref:1-acyl-sn-glycerol-3-phosphate acyltransferase n=1 Tax=Roseovarius amoyensis TaxID=2211448 RepID=UPI000DBE8317|nr:1-acyl-sn-glycerol-3-phosphate acyltransferase [Roseovarius amoyensis]